jgi:hypothetical protein
MMDIKGVSDISLITEYKERFGESSLAKFSDYEISDEFYARDLEEECDCDDSDSDPHHQETDDVLDACWQKIRLGKDIGEEIRYLIWLRIGKHV